MNQLKHKDLGVQRGGVRGRKRTYHNVTDEKISKLMEINFQQRTEAKIKWAANCYNEWREMRLDRVDYEEEIYDANFNDISNLTKANLEFTLCRFICEIRKSKDDTDYPGKTLYQDIVFGSGGHIPGTPPPWIHQC